jgi:hypothetical protein
MDPTLLIGDIVERDSSKSSNADFHDAPASSTGFPLPKRRWKSSAFKQQRAGSADSAAANTSAPPHDTGAESGRTSGVKDGANDHTRFEKADRMRIDKENQQRLADMTPEEIAQAQQDLMSGLNPDLIKRLLQRANIDDTGSGFLDGENSSESHETDPTPETKVEEAQPPIAPVASPPAKSSSDSSGNADAPHSSKKIALDYDEDAEPPQMPPDLFPITNPPSKMHIPPPPSLPDLDPSDPNFLETLHKKYFPNLPADPSKLAWMAPVPTADSAGDKDSPYYPHPEIAVSALRFDFKGKFLSPRVSRSIPTTKGLHNHGQAPEAAGYTIGELARLARSAVPAQRCIAFQTLGRILYRLGLGEWGKTEHDPIAMGIWAAVKEGRVMESLTEAAATDGGHRGSQAYATEALWLFEKGGWREKVRGR